MANELTSDSSELVDKTKITSVVFESGITYIGSCLSYSDNLASITIPSTVATVGSYAFFACYKLRTVNFYGSNAQWNSIRIGDGNECLNKATLYCFFNMSGTCGAQGDNLTWSLHDNGELVISGNGEMAYYSGNPAPWYDNRTINYCGDSTTSKLNTPK